MWFKCPRLIFFPLYYFYGDENYDHGDDYDHDDDQADGQDHDDDDENDQDGRDTCGQCPPFNVSAHYFYGLTVTFHGRVQIS